MPSEKSMIEELRELESELREKGEYRKANIIDLFIKHSMHCKISKSVISEKIKKLREQSKTAQDIELLIFDSKRDILEEILGGKII